MQITLTKEEENLFVSTVDHLRKCAQGCPGFLDPTLLHSSHGRAWPLWLVLCKMVLVEKKYQTATELLSLVKVMTGGCDPLVFQSPECHWQHEPSDITQCSPEQVAKLASNPSSPQNLQQRLLVDFFSDTWPPSDAPDLDLTQLLVADWTGAAHSGRLARLEMWRLSPEQSAKAPGEAPGAQIVRAPGVFVPVTTESFTTSTILLRP